MLVTGLTITQLSVLVLHVTNTTSTVITSASDKCWKPIAPIAGGTRQEHSVAAIGTDVYVIGGLGSDGLATGRAERYSTVTNKWSTVAPLPLAVHHPNLATVDGKLFLIGSLADGSEDGALWPASAATFSYDSANDTWMPLAPMPDPRGSSVLGVHGKRVYIAGGLSRAGKAVSTVSSFDTVTNTWTSLPASPLPEVRDHAGGGIVSDIMYVVGGRTGSQNSVRGTTFALNVSDSAGQWYDVAKMPTSRGGIAVAIQGTRIFAFGGEGNPAMGTGGVFPDTEVFDTISKTWSREAAMRTPRHGNGAVSVGDWIYVPGGGMQQGGGAMTATLDAFGPGPC